MGEENAILSKEFKIYENKEIFLLINSLWIFGKCNKYVNNYFC